MKELKKYIKERQKKSRSWTIHKTFPVISVGEDNDISSLKEITSIIERKVPKHLFKNIEILYFTFLPEMDERNLSAIFRDGAIFINPDITGYSKEEIVKEFIHELAHSLEEDIYSFIFEDEKLIKEFISKRKFFASTLERLKLASSKTIKLLSSTIDYNEEIDLFLFRLERLINYCNSNKLDDLLDKDFTEVYETLRSEKETIKAIKLHNISTIEDLIGNLFIDVYSINSLQEFYASGFEEYFFDQNHLTSVSPLLYYKISAVVKEEIR